MSGHVNEGRLGLMPCAVGVQDSRAPRRSSVGEFATEAAECGPRRIAGAAPRFAYTGDGSYLAFWSVSLADLLDNLLLTRRVEGGVGVHRRVEIPVSEVL